jgi:hypothetical protein
MTNLQAEYEGRAYRAGHDPQLPGRGEGSMKDLARYFATAMATLAELLRHRADFAGLEQWVSARTWTRAPAAAPAQDADGFRHFGATPAGTRYDRSGDEPDYFRQLEAVLLDAPGFLTGLAEAVQRDFERFAGADGTPDVAATEGDPRP